MNRSLSTRSARSVKRPFLLVVVVIYVALLAFLSLRAIGDGPFDRTVGLIGRGYLHLPAYALLAMLLSLFPRTRRGAAPWLLATGVGWLLEFLQVAAPTRTFNLLGLGLDAGGALLGWLVACVIGRWWRVRA
jgi:VanZ family protein